MLSIEKYLGEQIKEQTVKSDATMFSALAASNILERKKGVCFDCVVSDVLPETLSLSLPVFPPVATAPFALANHHSCSPALS